jgi:Family of unknown function (DUF6200)
MMAGTPETSSAPKQTRDAVVVDLGTKRKKQISRLRRGQGPLMEEVNQVINELKTAGAITGTVQPVIVVVRERSQNGFPFFGFLK